MEPRLTDHLRLVFILIILLSTGSSENDQQWKFCGIWQHGKGSLSLNISLSTGCNGIVISANSSSLSINGQITAQCKRSEVISHKPSGLDPEGESKFCLYWEPLLDQLKLQIGGKNLTLCLPASQQGPCCTDLSDGPKSPQANYGIQNVTIIDDFITNEIRESYNFTGASANCKALCYQAGRGSAQVNMIEDHSCAHSTVMELKNDFRGCNVTSPAIHQGVSAVSAITVHIPPALKQAAKKTKKVVFTFFTNNSLFQDVSLLQEDHEDVRVLDDVVEINVENEVIVNLPEPIRIVFHHDVIPKSHSAKCVSWDTKKDSLQVNWLVDGCETRHRDANHTECLCNHLTYFTVLVQMEPRPVRHLLALTAITSLGCAVSAISCVALIIYLCRKRRAKEPSTPIHLGLAVSLFLLNLLFFFTGVLANVVEEGVCPWVGAGLHYSLLSAFTWMGIEVFYTFWLVCRIFRPTLPPAYVWYLVGFVLPAAPVIILVAVRDIYGVRKVVPSDDVSKPYLMCWMDVSHKALLAHYFTNITVLAILVFSGFVMLFLVYREIRKKNEWKENRVAFLSIWGLCCLFGTTWALTFLDFGPLSDFVLFLSCILNSLQGFFLMLRFYMLTWMRKKAHDSASRSTSSGSTRQPMIPGQEKS